MHQKRVALIGIGNIMFCDEGLGAYAVRYIEKNYTLPSNLEVVEGGTLGFTLMTYYQEYDKIIVVGTGSHEGESGSILHETAEDILAKGPIRKTANEVEITMMIEICSFSENMGEVELVTMVPDDIVSVKNGLSQRTLKSMPEFIERIVAVLQENNLSLELKEQKVSLEEIIEEFANPTQISFQPEERSV